MVSVRVFRVSEGIALPAAIEAVRNAIADARRDHCSKLLAVAPRTHCISSPSLATRVGIMRDWAREGDGGVEVALVCESSLLDPERFGLTMARQFGLVMDVFDSEAKALAWLAMRK